MVKKKSKKLAQNFDDDDFAGNIENAIAAVLKKDGIEPLPPPKIEKRYDGRDSPFTEEQPATRHKGKKRKRRDNDDVKKKKKKAKKMKLRKRKKRKKFLQKLNLI